MSLKEYTRKETGTITGISVLPETAEGSNFEINLTTEGTLGSVKYVAHWSYKQIQRFDGSIFGSGDGVMQTECGEVINMKGSGSAAGTNPDGSVPFKVINHHHTKSEKFSFLNGTAAVGSYDVSAEGSTTGTFEFLE